MALTAIQLHTGLSLIILCDPEGTDGQEADPGICLECLRVSIFTFLGPFLSVTSNGPVNSLNCVDIGTNGQRS